VYAGGDDVLAFTSVDSLLDTLVELRAAFSGHRSGDGRIDLTTSPSGFTWDNDRLFATLGPDATASVGVAIAHYKTPLGLVLDSAYSLERDHAKAREGKDAFALGLLRRSGARTETCLPFRSIEINYPHGTAGMLRDLVRDLHDHDVSPTFLRTLHRELFPLMDRHGRLNLRSPQDARDLVESETKRLLLRRPEASKLWATQTAGKLTDLYASTASSNAGLKNFLSALDIALFLYKESAPIHAPRDHTA
jgi:CRISPR-associated protein Cmr2